MPRSGDEPGWAAAPAMAAAGAGAAFDDIDGRDLAARAVERQREEALGSGDAEGGDPYIFARSGADKAYEDATDLAFARGASELSAGTTSYLGMLQGLEDSIGKGATHEVRDPPQTALPAHSPATR